MNQHHRFHVVLFVTSLIWATACDVEENLDDDPIGEALVDDAPSLVDEVEHGEPGDAVDRSSSEERDAFVIEESKPMPGDDLWLDYDSSAAYPACPDICGSWSHAGNCNKDGKVANKCYRRCEDCNSSWIEYHCTFTPCLNLN